MYIGHFSHWHLKRFHVFVTLWPTGDINHTPHNHPPSFHWPHESGLMNPCCCPFGSLITTKQIRFSQRFFLLVKMFWSSRSSPAGMCYSKFNIKGQLRVFRRMDIEYLTRTQGGLDPGKATGVPTWHLWCYFFTRNSKRDLEIFCQ